MVAEQKKKYMKHYNQLPHVKAGKAAYMRRARSQKDEEASKNLVQMLLDMGYENLAFEYAQERAPEMLATIRMPARRKK